MGTHLSHFLSSRRLESSILSRRKTNENSGVYHWDPEQDAMDLRAFENCSAIIHLAGAGIADKRWTEKRKKEILDSRVQGSNLLFKSLKNSKHRIKTVVAASAVGIYGNGGDEWKVEESNIGSGFLPDTCRQWETSIRQIEELGIRLVILRIGVVLAKDGGALPQMALPVKLFLGASLGSGKQYISWIHVDDLCRIFLEVVEKESLEGIYNAVSSDPVSNKEFYIALAEKLERPLWPINVPSFIMKLILGEKAEIVLQGQRVSNAKLLNSGFDFNYKTISQAFSRIVS